MTLSKLLKSVALVGFAGAVTFSMSADPVEAKTRWKMHAAFASTVAVIGPPSRRLAASVKAMSDGDFDIKVVRARRARRRLRLLRPGISQGAFEAAYGHPRREPGQELRLRLLRRPGRSVPAAPEFAAWMLHGGGVELAEETYARDNIKYLLCGMIPPETSGWFREPITSLDQLKGLKMRFFGVGAKVMQKFGVSTQQLAAADIYPALERGTIDATEFSMPAIDKTLGLNQIAKHNYFPGWHQQSTTNETPRQHGQVERPDGQQQAPCSKPACKAETGPWMIADGEASQFEAMQANEPAA